MSLHLRVKPLNEQQELVVRLKDEEKLTHDEIARRLGVSGHRARQLYAEARQRRKDFARHGEESLFLLPGRVRHFVELYDLGNRTQIRAAIESGRLRWDYDWGRLFLGELSVRHCGWDTWVVLHEWAGLPAPSPAGNRLRVEG